MAWTNWTVTVGASTSAGAPVVGFAGQSITFEPSGETRGTIAAA